MIITTIKQVGNGYLINGETCISGKIPQYVQDAIDGTGDYGGNPITVEPEFTAEEISANTQQALTQIVQRHLDTAAQALSYDSILSACSYATSSSPFGDEGRVFVTWRDAVWSYCYQVLADVEAETRTIPTSEELIAELPALVLP